MPLAQIFNNSLLYVMTMCWSHEAAQHINWWNFGFYVSRVF